MEKKYVHSGKFNPGLTIAWAVVGLVAGAVISVVYTAIANLNPFIYLNFLALIGAVYMLMQTSIFLIKRSKCRNKTVNAVVTLLMCLFSWYVGWAALMAYQFEIDLFWWLAHPGKLLEGMLFYADNVGMTLNNSQIPPLVLKIIYGGELLAYFVPVFLVSNEKLYYCEFCEGFLKQKNHFFTETDLVAEHLDSIKTGDLGFVDKAQSKNRFDKACNAVPEQYNLNLHTCPGCGAKVFNFYHVNMKLKKGKYEVATTTPLVENHYAARTEQ